MKLRLLFLGGFQKVFTTPAAYNFAWKGLGHVSYPGNFPIFSGKSKPRTLLAREIHHGCFRWSFSKFFHRATDYKPCYCKTQTGIKGSLGISITELFPLTIFAEKTLSWICRCGCFWEYSRFFMNVYLM